MPWLARCSYGPGSCPHNRLECCNALGRGAGGDNNRRIDTVFGYESSTVGMACIWYCQTVTLAPENYQEENQYDKMVGELLPGMVTPFLSCWDLVFTQPSRKLLDTQKGR